MKLYRMGDKSTPPNTQCDLPVFAFYAAGQAENIWTPAQVAHIEARWALPICVAIDPARNATLDAMAYADTVANLGWHKGTALAIDTEAVTMGEYLARFDMVLQGQGHTLVHYESQAGVTGNPPTSGGKWLAQWNGKPLLAPGTVATQFATAKMGNTPWDLSVISSAVPLHELNPAQTAGSPYEQVDVALPVLTRGQAGWAVAMLQGLLLAAMPETPQLGLDDGVFGPITAATLAQWQEMYGVGEPAGTCGPQTWTSLLYRQ